MSAMAFRQKVQPECRSSTGSIGLPSDSSAKGLPLLVTVSRRIVLSSLGARGLMASLREGYR